MSAGGGRCDVHLRFAEPLLQSVLQAMCERAAWRLAPGFRNDCAYLPIGRPRGGLPVVFEHRRPA